MLKIINNLAPFFQDCYRRINVREYAKMIKISPPSASKLLNGYVREGLLKKETHKMYHYFSANNENWLFTNLSRIYWRMIVEQYGLLEQIKHDFKMPLVILFGSLSKAEVNERSDLDIAIISPSTTKIDYSRFEKKIKRKIQLFTFTNPEAIKSKELYHNILSGYILLGGW